ncbi:Hypothetical protein RY70_574 [Bifidobacterium bifidum]|nr:Hypothetical protein RY70_574 [Bifidobacterium bifidum]
MPAASSAKPSVRKALCDEEQYWADAAVGMGGADCTVTGGESS